MCYSLTGDWHLIWLNGEGEFNADAEDFR